MFLSQMNISRWAAKVRTEAPLLVTYLFEYGGKGQYFVKENNTQEHVDTVCF